MEAFGSELERRKRAVEMVGEGVPKAEVARRVDRSREWVHKWWRRWSSDGPDGLVDQSRARHRQDRVTPVEVGVRVLEVRDALEANPVANVGSLSILASLEREGFSPLPSVSTIERILRRAGRTQPYRRRQRSGIRLPLPVITGPGIWHQADWIQDRYLTGGIKFHSLQISDVGSHGITATQYRHRYVRNAVDALWKRTWPFLSIPQALGTDNAFAHTTHKNNPWTEWTRLCLFFGTEVIISPPGELGWTNHVEAVNELWQSRTIRTRHFSTLDELRTGSEEACWWFNHHRPILDPTVHGTRYPAEYIAAHTDQLRWPPDINLADHRDHKGRLTLPLAPGRVTHLRHVNNDHTINVTHTTWPVPPTIPTGALVTATITTTDETLTIRHRGEAVTTHPYPIRDPITTGYYPPANHGLLDHI